MLRRLFYTLTISCALCIVPFALSNGTMCAQSTENSFTDVDLLGDIWVIVLDGSRSMTKFSAETAITGKLKTTGIIGLPNYQHDHFRFYVSGLYPAEKVSRSQIKTKEMRSILSGKESFTDLLIHDTPLTRYNKLRTYKSARDLLASLSRLVANCDFPYGYSYVSQIRLCALDKITKEIRDNGVAFRNIYIVTLTDESDVDDQWRTDYRNTLLWQGNRVTEISKLNTYYLYNELNNTGSGYLEEQITSFVPSAGAGINVWLHRYHTRQQLQNDTIISADARDVISVSARNGHNIKIRKRAKTYAGDTITYVQINNIVIDGDTIPFNTKLTDEQEFAYSFANSFFHRNTVACEAEIQVEYTDSIYGKHYKKYPIEYTETQLSGIQLSWLASICGIVGFVVLMVVIYLLVILPRRRLFSVISDRGSVKVKRGFRLSWHERLTTILTADLSLRTDSKRWKSFEEIDTLLFNHHRNIIHQPATTPISDDPAHIVVEASQPLEFNSDKVTAIDSSIDIEDYYSTRSAEYSQLLKHLYRATKVFGLYEKRKEAYNKTYRQLILWYIKAVNFFSPHYYYIVNIGKIKDDDTLSCSSRLLADKSLLLEFKVNTTDKSTALQRKVNNIVNSYYADQSAPAAQTLLCYSRKTGSIEWFVVQLTGNSLLENSLRNVRLLFNYLQTFDGQLTDDYLLTCAKSLSREIRKALKSKHIFTYCCDNSLDDSADNVVFNISQSSYLSFVSLVDDAPEAKAIQLYSPFADSERDSTTTYLRKPTKGPDTSTAHLFASFLPYDKSNIVDGRHLLSENLVYYNNGAEKLTIGNNNLRFMQITIAK